MNLEGLKRKVPVSLEMLQATEVLRMGSMFQMLTNVRQLLSRTRQLLQHLRGTVT